MGWVYKLTALIDETGRQPKSFADIDNFKAKQIPGLGIEIPKEKVLDVPLPTITLPHDYFKKQTLEYFYAIICPCGKTNFHKSISISADDIGIACEKCGEQIKLTTTPRLYYPAPKQNLDSKIAVKNYVVNCPHCRIPSVYKELKLVLRCNNEVCHKYFNLFTSSMIFSN